MINDGLFECLRRNDAPIVLVARDAKVMKEGGGKASVLLLPALPCSSLGLGTGNEQCALHIREAAVVAFAPISSPRGCRRACDGAHGTRACVPRTATTAANNNTAAGQTNS